MGALLVSIKASWLTWFNFAQLANSWTSLVAQMIKNPLAMQETLVLSLGGEDPLEKGRATHSSILAWRIPWQRSLAGFSPWSYKDSNTTKQLTYFIVNSHPVYRVNSIWHVLWCFPGGSNGKEFACNSGDPGLILVSRRSPGERMTSHFIILAWRIPWME